MTPWSFSRRRVDVDNLQIVLCVNDVDDVCDVDKVDVDDVGAVKDASTCSWCRWCMWCGRSWCRFCQGRRRHVGYVDGVYMWWRWRWRRRCRGCNKCTKCGWCMLCTWDGRLNLAAVLWEKPFAGAFGKNTSPTSLSSTASLWDPELWTNPRKWKHHAYHAALCC